MSESERVVACLSIGSSDSGGGAGVQGDVKAFASVGCFASTVLVGVTAQNTQGVTGRFTVPVEFVARQLDAVLSDIPIQTIKIGTTWSVELLTYLSQRLAPTKLPIVFDPVMVTTAGAALGGEVRAVIACITSKMVGLSTVLTPNREEAKLLLSVTDDSVSTRTLAEKLFALGARSVVVSGHAADVDDWYVDAGRSERVPGVRYAVDAEHGVGCAHSSMTAGFLALGWPVFEAVVEARRRAGEGVKHGLTMIGGGRHPVDVLGLRARRV